MIDIFAEVVIGASISGIEIVAEVFIELASFVEWLSDAAIDAHNSKIDVLRLIFEKNLYWIFPNACDLIRLFCFVISFPAIGLVKILL